VSWTTPSTDRCAKAEKASNTRKANNNNFFIENTITLNGDKSYN